MKKKEIARQHSPTFGFHGERMKAKKHIPSPFIVKNKNLAGSGRGGKAPLHTLCDTSGQQMVDSEVRLKAQTMPAEKLKGLLGFILPNADHTIYLMYKRKYKTRPIRRRNCFHRITSLERSKQKSGSNDTD